MTSYKYSKYPGPRPRKRPILWTGNNNPKWSYQGGGQHHRQYYSVQIIYITWFHNHSALSFTHSDYAYTHSCLLNFLPDSLLLPRSMIRYFLIGYITTATAPRPTATYAWMSSSLCLQNQICVMLWVSSCGNWSSSSLTSSGVTG